MGEVKLNHAYKNKIYFDDLYVLMVSFISFDHENNLFPEIKKKK